MIDKIELSPNFSKKKRSNKSIKFVIIHYTGMQSEIESIKRLKSRFHKVSCHYLINREGKIIQIVQDNKVSWHAGKSRWKNFINLNEKSIGIELVNKGHDFGYEKFSNKQINSLIKLCLKLKRNYKIKKENFLGHSDVSPLRKIDPGEKFPWKKLSKFKIGLWYKKIRKKQFCNSQLKTKIFYKNLYKIGYRYFKKNQRHKNDYFVVKAFQRKYLPNFVSGKLNRKTMEICHFLANFK